MLLADLLSRAQALVGMRRRHADIDDRHVRRVAPHLEHQLVGVPRLPDDVEAGVGEDARDALTEKNGIIRDDYPHGISARMRVPRPGSLSTRRTPSSDSTRSASPRRPDP